MKQNMKHVRMCNVRRASVGTTHEKEGAGETVQNSSGIQKCPTKKR